MTHSLATVPTSSTSPTTIAEIDEYSTALDVEAQLLRSLLCAPAESANRAVAALTSADIYRPVNAALFTAISVLVEAGKPHNSARVFTTLQQEGRTSGHLGKQLTKALADITTVGVPSAELKSPHHPHTEAAPRHPKTAETRTRTRS